MYKKKKAITLIETLMYLSILSVIIGLFSFSVDYFKSKEYEIKVKDDLNKIQWFIIKSKMNCMKDNAGGIIEINNDSKKTLSFEKRGKREIMNLEVLYISSFDKIDEIKIDDRGYIKDKLKIILRGKDEERYTITSEKNSGVLNVKK